MLKKILQPSDILVVVDTREQRPWRLSPLRTTGGTLPTGDYSVAGLTSEIALERKSMDDLLMCVGRERLRFERELQRLRSYATKSVICECSWLDLERGDWRSQVTPEQAIGSVLGWIAMGIPVVMAGNADKAGKYAAKILFIAARRRWRELGSFFEEHLETGTKQRGAKKPVEEPT